MRINSLNRIESSTKVLAYPSGLVSKFDSREKQFFIKLCLALGITNDTEFEKIPVSSFKRNSFKKLLNQYGEYFVIIGITNDGMPWYSLYDQRLRRQVVLPHNSIAFTKLLAITDVLYVAHGSKELADRVAQQKAERLVNQEYEYYFGRNSNFSNRDKSGYRTRETELNDFDRSYGLNKDSREKYFDIIEKDPESKLQSLRNQYTKYLNNAYTAAVKDGFSKESLQALEVIINVGQSVRGSEFEDIEDALKSNNIERAVAWMFDLQIKLDRFKRTGKPY